MTSLNSLKLERTGNPLKTNVSVALNGALLKLSISTRHRACIRLILSSWKESRITGGNKDKTISCSLNAFANRNKKYIAGVCMMPCSAVRNMILNYGWWDLTIRKLHFPKQYTQKGYPQTSKHHLNHMQWLLTKEFAIEQVCWSFNERHSIYLNVIEQ